MSSGNWCCQRAGYDPLEAVDDQPGQHLLAHLLQAQLLFFPPGSSLYPVMGKLEVEWPITSLSSSVFDELSEENKAEKRKQFKGVATNNMAAGGMCRTSTAGESDSAFAGNASRLNFSKATVLHVTVHELLTERT